MPKGALARGTSVIAIAAMLVVVGIMLLTMFTHDDQLLLALVFVVSSLAAAIWLSLRGAPQPFSGWLAPVLIAFGPAFLMGAYIAIMVDYVSSG